MAGCTLADFDILIQGDRSPYTVTVFYGGTDARHRYSASGTFTPDILNREWQQAYHILGETLSFADADAVTSIGERLWNALMQGRVRDLWIAARNDVDQEHVEGLRLRLDLQSPHVAALPWESLYDQDRNVLFAGHPDFALVRVASLYHHVGRQRRTQVQLPLRVLVVAPDDPAGIIDARREIAEIEQIMTGIDGQYSGTKYVEIEKLTDDFSITQLRKRLATFKPNVLHFIGHGEPNGIKLFPRGRAYLASTQSLRSLLERTTSVKLVVLNACLTGRTARPIPFSGVAEQIMQAGVPAVIAMQYQIRDDVAIDFAHFLYEELLGGACPGMIDVAMSAARSGLYAANPGDFSFGTPILWLNRHDGSIFALDANEIESSKETVNKLPALPHVPALDVQQESAWIDEMVATTELEQLHGEFAFLRNKWINYVNELRSLLIQVAALLEQRDRAHAEGKPVVEEEAAYEAKVADYRRFKAALLRVKRLIEDANRNR